MTSPSDIITEKFREIETVEKWYLGGFITEAHYRILRVGFIFPKIKEILLRSYQDEQRIKKEFGYMGANYN
jgi:hypothetical protein